jgi:hypothetical protein
MRNTEFVVFLFSLIVSLTVWPPLNLDDLLHFSIGTNDLNVGTPRRVDPLNLLPL